MSEPSGELSHFEELSAVTPKKMPYAIILGFVALGPLLGLINWLAPNQGVADMKEKQKKAEEDTPAVVQTAEDIEDI